MDKSTLKKVIKPLIKECLKEVLVEEGLVRVISEYNNSQGSGQVLKNNDESLNLTRELKKESLQKKTSNQLVAKKAAVQTFGFDIFEGTSPAPPDGEIPEGEGVNISSLINENASSWTQHLGIPNRKKA